MEVAPDHGLLDEERQRLVANMVPALLAYIDHDARYAWCNEAYRRWFGRTIVGLHMREALGEEAWGLLLPHVERALAGEAVTFDRRLVYSDGQVRDVRASYVPDRAPDGRVRGFVALVNDVTEVRSAERALRASERMLAESQRAAQVGSWEAILDGAPRVPMRLRWSDETYRIFGYEPGAVDIDYDFFIAAVHPDDRELVMNNGAMAGAPGEHFQKEYRIVRPDGTVRVIHGWSHVERDAGGRMIRLLGTCQDVTERRHALEQLTEADRRKDEFLAMLSHELRNPLAPILTAVEVLRLADPNDAETAATFHALIERQVLHMKRLLDDLLDVSRVNQGKIELRRELTEVSSVVRQAVEVSHPLIAQKEQRLSFTAPGGAAFVDADPTRLVQVFGNLLNNASKYSDRGDPIEVALAVEESEVVVRVRDQGMGMSPELLERAFDLFVQETRSLDRAQGGMGIGLTMVRRLVDMHGGSVRAYSAGPGQGCEIVVRLPRACADRPVPQRAQRRWVTAAATRQRRILVVDDNQDAARALGHLLAMLGHDVRLAHDGPTALATFADAPSELVFIDIGLPGMDGYALARALRAPGVTPASLIAVTGYGRDEDVRRSAAHGFDDHLVKPVDLPALGRIAALTGAPAVPGE